MSVCKQEAARLFCYKEDFDNARKLCHMFVAMWQPKLLREGDWPQVSATANAWLYPVRRSTFKIEDFLDPIPKEDILIQNPSGSFYLPRADRPWHEVCGAGILLCDAGDSETGMKVRVHPSLVLFANAIPPHPCSTGLLLQACLANACSGPCLRCPCEH